MDNVIRVLQIFSISGPLAFMFAVLVIGIVVLYIARHIFKLEVKAQHNKHYEIEQRISALDYKIAQQIEHRAADRVDQQ